MPQHNLMKTDRKPGALRPSQSIEIIAAAMIWLGSAYGALAVDAASPQEIVARINVEIRKRNAHPDGRPLPVAAHWAAGIGGDGFSSDYQVEQLEKGIT